MPSAEIPPLFLEALARAGSSELTSNQIERLARQSSPEAARWAANQIELRQRAKTKFALADQMLFDRDALEMATAEPLAAYHASLFIGPAEDWTVGLGADLIALAARGPVTGFELDPWRLAYAQHNLAVHGLEAELLLADALTATQGRPAFVDPARRGGGRRFSSLHAFQPDPFLAAEKMGEGWLKLSPMARDEELAALGGVQFVSFEGQCREALVQVRGQGTLAIKLPSGERLEGGTETDWADAPGAYLYDADPAAVRAHALGHFGLAALGDHPGYLTGDDEVESPWLRRYRVLATDSLDDKRLRRALRELEAGPLVLKQRGAGLDLVALEKRLTGSGSRPLVLIFWRVDKRVWVTIAE